MLTRRPLLALGFAAILACAGLPAAAIGGVALTGLKADAYPNPVGLHGSVRVVAALADGARARDATQAMRVPGELTLVDLGGRRVATLWKGTLDQITFEVPFTARDERGLRLAPGLYFLVFRAGSHAVLSRVAIMR